MNTRLSLSNDYMPAFAAYLRDEKEFTADNFVEFLGDYWSWQDDFEAFVLERTKDLPKWQCYKCQEIELMTKGLCEKCGTPRARTVAQAEASHLRGLADFSEREERQGELRGMDYGTVYER
jgi:hypothetical protein